jgi:phosphatidylglycerol lysyltransferase
MSLYAGLRERISAPVGSTLAALLVLAMGVVNITSALVGIDPSRVRLLGQLLPLEVHQGSRTLAVLAGMMLCLLSWSLYRRKHQGWVAAAMILGFSAVLHLAKGLDIEESILALCVLILLLITRRQFTVRSDPWRFKLALSAVAWIFLGSMAYGVAGFYLLQRHFAPAFDLGMALESTLLLLTQTGAPSLSPIAGLHHRDAYWFCDSLVATGIISAIYIALLLLRPLPAALQSSRRERDELHRLMQRFGAPPLGYFSLLPGLSHMFSSDRHAALAYKVVDAVAIVLGDPVGDPEAIPALIERFQQHCFTNDWMTTWYEITKRWLPVLRTHGLSAVKGGEDALVDLPALQFTGKAWQDVRTALSRMPREGYSAVWYDVSADPRRWLDRLDAISATWLATQHGAEKGFSLGTWPLAQQFADEQRMLALADAQDLPHAFLTFVPILGAEGGWALDLMRRDAATPPGAMEFLLASALLRFKDEGAVVVSLGLSPLSDMTPDEGGSAPDILARARALVFENYNKLYNFKGLNRFKAKFQPRWEARYLAYPSLVALPRVLLALLKVHAGDRQPNR